MIWIILTIAAAYAIKGGWHGPLRNLVKNPTIHRLLDGKILSTLIFASTIMFVTGTALSFLLAAAGWLFMVSPKIGRPIGEAGGFLGNWDKDENPYHRSERKAYLIQGLKNGAIRHIYGGAMLTLFLGPDIWILAGAAIPLIYFVGVSLEQFRTKQIVASWHLAEPMVGAWIGYIVYITTVAGS